MWCTWIHINICSGQCGVQDTVNICSGQVNTTHVEDNVVYMDTVNTCSGQGGVHGYSQHM